MAAGIAVAVSVIAVLVAGCCTALVTWSLLTHPGAIDYVGEVRMMAGVLNVALPIGTLAALTTVTLRVWQRRIDSAMLVGFLAAHLAAYTCSIVLWAGLAAAHGSMVNLWTQIWWMP